MTETMTNICVLGTTVDTSSYELGNWRQQATMERQKVVVGGLVDLVGPPRAVVVVVVVIIVVVVHLVRMRSALFVLVPRNDWRAIRNKKSAVWVRMVASL